MVGVMMMGVMMMMGIMVAIVIFFLTFIIALFTIFSILSRLKTLVTCIFTERWVMRGLIHISMSIIASSFGTWVFTYQRMRRISWVCRGVCHG